MTAKLHLLHEGNLADAPGRDESWAEYVGYCGDNRWLLVVKGTSFDGVGPGETYKEKKGTRALIKWVFENDAADQEALDSRSHPTEGDDLDVADKRVSLSSRAARLLEIAREEKAAYCVACLEGWLAGTWQPSKRGPQPRILAINGVTKRGVWLHVYRPAFSVETTVGHGYLEQPDEHRIASLFLHSGVSSVRLPKHLLPRLAALQPEFDTLKESLYAQRKP